ncbi:MAG: hypothetical protein ACFFB3_22610, partial [Candidatus Hodarchaeota archaeon]
VNGLIWSQTRQKLKNSPQFEQHGWLVTRAKPLKLSRSIIQAIYGYTKRQLGYLGYYPFSLK